MNSLWVRVTLAFAVLGASASHGFAAPAPPESTPAPAEVSRVQSPPKKEPTGRLEGSSKMLVLHKPLLPPEWGEVIQYRRETPRSLFDRGEKETVFEFVLRGPNGILRVAYYHESPDGSGFWEIWVWDQP